MSSNLRMFAQDYSEEELRVICEGSFVPRRDHGVYAHGAARGQVSSNQTDRDHYCGGNEGGKRASDWQVGNRAGAYTFSPERKGCSDSETSADHPQGVTNDYAYNVSPCRTERDAKADLMCAPRDRVRERAVRADGCRQRAQRLPEPAPAKSSSLWILSFEKCPGSSLSEPCWPGSKVFASRAKTSVTSEGMHDVTDETICKKRRYQRISLPKGMRVAWHGGDLKLFSRVRTLGMGGLFISAPDPPRAGTKLRLSFEVPGGNVQAEAIVRNIVPGEGMGVEFTRLSLKDRVLLENLLKRLLR